MNIVFLYSEVVGYTLGILKQIAKLNPNCNISLVYWDKKKLSKYKFEDIERVQFIARSSVELNDLKELLQEKNPEIIYVSGWMDSDYLKAIKWFKKSNKNVKIVAGVDDQWRGRFRQYLGLIYVRLVFSKFIDFLWIAGKPQYFYARLMGYSMHKIISDLYSADTEYFNKKSNFTKRFVYLGRFSPEKGSLNLVKSYNLLDEKIRKEWPLVLIGDGPEKEEILKVKCEEVIVKPFLQGETLVNELMHGGVSCSPSLRDQWGVSIHEFALMGYPMVLTNVCGAATEFLIEGYNGFLFEPSNFESNKNALEKITKLGDEEINKFRERSYTLGHRINSEISAASFLSVLYK